MAFKNLVDIAGFAGRVGNGEEFTIVWGACIAWVGLYTKINTTSATAVTRSAIITAKNILFSFDI